MRLLRCRESFLLPIALLALASPASAVPFFSLDAASPTLFLFPGYSPSDVLSPPPLVGFPPPPIFFPAVALGLGGFGPPFDDLDAIAIPGPGPLGLLHFSVDRASTGVPIVFGAGPSPSPFVYSNVFRSSGLGQQAGDIYVRGVPGTPTLPIHLLAYNQDELGAQPILPYNLPALPPIDAVDALELVDPLFPTLLPTFMSMTSGHLYLGASGFVGCGGDLFSASFGGAFPALPFTALGLGSCGDEVDALAVVPPGDFYFSLAPGSPSLLVASPIAACTLLGCSAADIFVAPGAGGVALLALSASELGLLPTDNVTSLAMPPCLAPLGIDSDGDGHDDACDNCTLEANPSQFDADVDGYGNRCDADYDNSGSMTIADFAIYKQGHGTALGSPFYRPDLDFNESGSINIGDFIFFRLRLPMLLPGPSGLACAGTRPCSH